MSGKRLNKKIRNKQKIDQLREKTRKYHIEKEAKLAEENEAAIRNMRIIYRKRLISNYFIIPVSFILIANLCSEHRSSKLAAFIIFLSMIVHGMSLYVHNYERIRKSEKASKNDYSFASDVMQYISYIVLVCTALACACIIFFAK